MKDGMHMDHNGNKEWYLNDRLHREGGPACDNFNGSKLWYVNGLRHREDGPASMYPYASNLWFVRWTYLLTDDY
jgi:hypothetical protein